MYFVQLRIAPQNPKTPMIDVLNLKYWNISFGPIEGEV